MIRNCFCFCLALLLLGCGNKPLEIPIKYGTHLMMTCTFNDSIKGNFMFDTGAYGLHIDSTYNETSRMFYYPMYMPPEDEMSETDKVFYLNRPKPKKIIITHPVDLYLADNSSIINLKSSFGKQFDGIVGWDLFKDKILEVDYINEKFIISDPDDHDLDSSFTEIPLALHKKWFCIDMTTHPSKNLPIYGRYLLDMGFGGCVIYTGKTYREFRMDTMVTKRKTFRDDWGLYAIQRTLGGVFRGNSVKLNKFEVKEPILEYSIDTIGILGNTEYVALLGNKFFERFRTIINLRSGILYLKPNKDYEKKETFKSLGFACIDRTDICDGFIVHCIYDNSDADKGGLRSGDVLVQFNGKPVRNDPDKMYKAIYENENEEKALTFRRKDSSFVLKLKLKSEL